MSNTIYSTILPVISQDKNKYNYVYQITEISTGMKYIGSHGTEKSDPIKDLKKYKSSTRDQCFELNQKLNPLNYHYEILSYHPTRDEAYNEEGRLHKLYDVKCNIQYYNRANHEHNGFNVAGKFYAKDKFGNRFFINCDDTRYLTGELVGANKDRVIVKDNHDNKFIVDKYDPRYLSGELVGINKGKVTVKDEDGNTFQVNKDDPRYLSGELISASVGKVTVKDEDGNTLQIDVNDPRYLSGELISISVGKVIVKDKNENTLQVDVNDPRYLSGELVHILADKIAVKDKAGNNYRVSKDDPLYLSGELVGIGKGSIVVQDKYGNMSRVSVDDPRYLSGELFSPCKGKIMINNGIQSKYINRDDEIPEGWSVGSKPTKKKGKSGAENVSAKKVSIHGKIYNCIKDAFIDLDITRAVLDRRLKSNKSKWIDWKYI